MVHHCHRLFFFLVPWSSLDFVESARVSRRAVPLWIATCSVLSLFIGVNPSVETICDWHTRRSMEFPTQIASSSPE